MRVILTPKTPSWLISIAYNLPVMQNLVWEDYSSIDIPLEHDRLYCLDLDIYSEIDNGKVYAIVSNPYGKIQRTVAEFPPGYDDIMVVASLKNEIHIIPEEEYNETRKTLSTS